MHIESIKTGTLIGCPGTMDIELLNKEKNLIQLKIIGADDTLIYPLVHQLQQDENVEDASYVTGHPKLDVPVLTIKVKNGKPQAALKKAAKALSTEFTGAREQIEKKLG